MKRILTLVLIAQISVFSLSAEVDWENYELVNTLLTLPGPGEPLIFENLVIFTAHSSLRRVGVAFAHENFDNVYWYRQLMVRQDPQNAPIPPGKKGPDPFKDSGIQFYIFEVPEHINELEYRLIINGLWTTDPVNSRIRRDPVTGLSFSVLPFNHKPLRPDPLKGLPQGLLFTFNAPPGEIITVAGDFNNWDPFMYELKEGPAGVYTINIPLPSGTYQYVFFYRGQRYTDQNNPKRIYARDGRAASVLVVP
jgi:hypothetical protein